jgi:hypothetical protein
VARSKGLSEYRSAAKVARSKGLSEYRSAAKVARSKGLSISARLRPGGAQP